MNISPISYGNSVSMKANSSKGSKKIQTNDIMRSYSPAAIGVVNGACWFGIGFLFDKMCKFLFKSNLSNKGSLIVNGAVGLVMGTYSYFKARQIQKSSNKA